MSRCRGEASPEVCAHHSGRAGPRPPARPGTPRNSRAARHSAGRAGAGGRRPCGARSRRPRRSGCSASQVCRLRWIANRVSCTASSMSASPTLARAKAARAIARTDRPMSSRRRRYAPSSPAIEAIIIRDQGSSGAPLMIGGSYELRFVSSAVTDSGKYFARSTNRRRCNMPQRTSEGAKPLIR